MDWLQMIRDKRAAVAAYATRHGATNLRLFGSVVRGEAGEASDFDLLVDMDEGRSLLDLIGLQQDLEGFLGRRVDVVTEADVSPHLRQRVLQEVIPL